MPKNLIDNEANNNNKKNNIIQIIYIKAKKRYNIKKKTDVCAMKKGH